MLCARRAWAIKYRSKARFLNKPEIVTSMAHGKLPDPDQIQADIKKLM
jgi:hypothetical protein